MSARGPLPGDASQRTVAEPSRGRARSVTAAAQASWAASPRRDPGAVLAASSFATGVRLLPRDLQADARRLYCVLRTIDDLVDEAEPHAAERVEALDRWAKGGRPDSPEAEALAELSRRHPLPREAFAEFCKGMRLDLEQAEIATQADLERYCGYAGGTVGAMLTALLGARRAGAERRMFVLGSAMQLTNILRDIDEDLERGRLYIPASEIARHGFPRPGGRERLLREQIERADALFAEGLRAIPMLRRGRRAMGVSGLLYREILRQIEREGFGRKPGRVSVPGWRKRMLIDRYAP